MDTKNTRLLKFLPEYYGHRMKNSGFVRGISTQEAKTYQENFVGLATKMV